MSSIARTTETLTQQQRDYLRLAFTPGVGPQLFQNLVEYFETPTEVLAAKRCQLHEVERIGPKLAEAIHFSSKDDLVDRIWGDCLINNVRILFPDDQEFPRLLREIPSPPLYLFIRGDIKPVDQLSIAIVGTRHATSYGRMVTEGLSRSLVRSGLTIISGLARGIDSIAHRSAMEIEGGRTIAFLGSSVTDIYPPEHMELAQQVSQRGALISETHPFSKPKAGVFPQRNRLISGMSLGVVIVEAADRSGSLITASHAGEQGRDLFAIPGPVNSRMSRGCNRLIRDGAILVQDAQDILDHLGPLVDHAEISPDRVIHHPAELQLNPQEQQVLQAIEDIPTDLDQVIVRSGLAPSRTLSTISALQMRGIIRRTGARTVQRC
ncbi:MAG: DNA-processing protein DprA [Planctomycetota bacterium]|nr:DNA-processing protein DprA [Planctomycetota bacterium]